MSSRISIPAPMLAVLMLAALAAPVRADGSGPVSEIRVGVLRHEAAFMTSRWESVSADANFEILFASPGFLGAILAPRPHLGVTANTDGGTSQAYFGLTWDADFSPAVFGEFSFGGSFHNGNGAFPLSGPVSADDRKYLGCSPLFRLSLAFGYRLNEHHSLSLMADHVSNGYLCEDNPGLDTFGLRWGYRF